jgi:hypothetical protein
MFDADTNRDGKLDSSDIKSLYLSEISGKRFTKVSMDLQLIDWNLIDSKSRLYFRTVEDTNKMGSLIKTMWCITTTFYQIMNGKYLTTNQFNSIVNAKSGYRSLNLIFQ